MMKQVTLSLVISLASEPCHMGSIEACEKRVLSVPSMAPLKPAILFLWLNKEDSNKEDSNK